jgi:uridine kinase
VATASPSEAARRVLDLARSRPATLGSGRLVCLDGPAGSGKTTLAAALLDLEPRGRVVHMDDLYAGWSGMRAGADQLVPLLRTLAGDRVGGYRRYDWHAAAYTATVTVEPTPLLVIEGVGSGASAVADLVTVLAWVWVPADLRLARGIERDGEQLRGQWDTWMHDEAALFVRERTEERADVLVDGTGERPPTVAG